MLKFKKRVRTTKILEYNVKIHMIFISYLLIAKIQRIKTTLKAQATRAHCLLFDEYLKCRERKIHRISLRLFIAACCLYQSLISMAPQFLSILLLDLLVPKAQGASPSSTSDSPRPPIQ